MKIEQQRGISVTSSVMTFQKDGVVFNRYVRSEGSLRPNLAWHTDALRDVARSTGLDLVDLPGAVGGHEGTHLFEQAPLAQAIEAFGAEGEQAGGGLGPDGGNEAVAVLPKGDRGLAGVREDLVLGAGVDEEHAGAPLPEEGPEMLPGEAGAHHHHIHRRQAIGGRLAHGAAPSLQAEAVPAAEAQRL
jgi:hypothetical protein